VLRGARQRLLRQLFAIACLPHEALSSLDAIARTWWRVHISRRRLLQWRTSSAVEHSDRGSLAAAAEMLALCPLFGIGTLALALLLKLGIAPLLPWCVLWLMAPWMAERFGRRLAMALYFAALGVAVAVAFGYVFYQPEALSMFFVLIFFLGIGGANFALYTLWLPEQYATNCRASAIAFVSSVGRFVGVAMVFLVGTAIQRYGSLGVPVAVTASVFVLGVLLLPFAVETKGKALPT